MTWFRHWFLVTLGMITFWCIGMIISLELHQKKHREIYKVWRSAIDTHDWIMCDMCESLSKAHGKTLQSDALLWPLHLIVGTYTKLRKTLG